MDPIFLELPITIDETRPLPCRHEEDLEHLAGAARGVLRLPRCLDCQREFWPSGSLCRFCFGRHVDWVTDPGVGVVNSWVKARKQYFAGDDERWLPQFGPAAS